MSVSFNLQLLEEISAGDQHKLKHLMKTFMDEAANALTKMKELYKARNFDEMHRIAHTVKPLYVSIGSEKASLTIKNIENYCRSAFFRELIPVEMQELEKINNEICNEMSSLL